MQDGTDLLQQLHEENSGWGAASGIEKRNIEIAQNALRMNTPVDDVIKLNRLSRQQTEYIKI